MIPTGVPAAARPLATVRSRRRLLAFALTCGLTWTSLLVLPRPLAAQEPQLRRDARRDSAVVTRNDSVSLHLVDVDLRAAVQALSQYMDRPVVFGGLTGNRVTLETPTAVPRTQVGQLLRGLLESQNLELVTDSGLYRVQQKELPHPATPAPVATPKQPGVVQLFVIHVRHARAADVAATVNALYGRASALGERGERPSTLSEQLRQQQMPPVGAPPPQAVPEVAGRAASLTGEVTIVPDPSTNSLLIRASEEDFELIQAAVREVDVRPLQVLIEVVIAEVRRDRSLDFGVAVNAPERRIKGTSQTTMAGSTTGSGLGDFVLRVMHVGGADLDVTLSAAAARGDVSIVSRPVLLATNNEAAQILVGSQRPFVQVAQALPTDQGVRNEVVQYRDVGTRLSVRPTISSDGYVALEVTQEVNQATAETQFNAPVISTRSVSTRLLIKDGQTIVLGGLTDREKDRTQQGVPVLSSIPLIGGLFGSTSRSTTQTELFLFLTPRVIRTDDDVFNLTEPLELRMQKVKP